MPSNRPLSLRRNHRTRESAKTPPTRHPSVSVTRDCAGWDSAVDAFPLRLVVRDRRSTAQPYRHEPTKCERHTFTVHNRVEPPSSHNATMAAVLPLGPADAALAERREKPLRRLQNTSSALKHATRSASSGKSALVHSSRMIPFNLFFNHSLTASRRVRRRRSGSSRRPVPRLCVAVHRVPILVLFTNRPFHARRSERRSHRRRPRHHRSPPRAVDLDVRDCRDVHDDDDADHIRASRVPTRACVAHRAWSPRASSSSSSSSSSSRASFDLDVVAQ